MTNERSRDRGVDQVAGRGGLGLALNLLQEFLAMWLAAGSVRGGRVRECSALHERSPAPVLGARLRPGSNIAFNMCLRERPDAFSGHA